jgi:hypothetical protein
MRTSPVRWEMLTESDLALLEKVASSNQTFRSIGLERILGDPELSEFFLASDAVYNAIFGDTGDVFVHVSPFLSFIVLLHRSSRTIATTSFVTEWVGPRKRVPLFDTTRTRSILQDPEARLFLAELLASFTHVSSGVVIERSERGLRRRRFSELDLGSLLDLAHRSSGAIQLQAVKRAGDLALLLAGVFPDYAGVMLAKSTRFQRAVWKAIAGAWKGGSVDHGGPDFGEGGELGLDALENVAASCYRAVIGDTIDLEGIAYPSGTALKRIAEDIEPARRALNFLTDRYLFAYRSTWFGTPN